MQDIQFIGYGVGGLFSGGSGGDANGGGGGGVKCPRCGCLNTKFCYYNNYNLSQPRFFCKGCRRYWTRGGVLRNVPVGGGCRKTKRSKQKTGDAKPSSTSDASVVAANISSGTPTEAAPTILHQCSTDNHQLCSEIGAFGSSMTSSTGDLSLGFISAPEISSLTQVQEMEDSLGLVDERSVVEYSRWSNGGGTAEDWGLFDQSYWLNNSDHQLNFLL